MKTQETRRPKERERERERESIEIQAMVRYDPDAFLTALKRIFTQNRDSSVRMSYKRYVPKKGPSSGISCCLVRAEGRSGKISTLVSEKERKQFHSGLADIMTIQMNNFKSRPKRKKKKKKTMGRLAKMT